MDLKMGLGVKSPSRERSGEAEVAFWAAPISALQTGFAPHAWAGAGACAQAEEAARSRQRPARVERRFERLRFELMGVSCRREIARPMRARLS
jgi:hypothetical protein